MFIDNFIKSVLQTRPLGLGLAGHQSDYNQGRMRLVLQKNKRFVIKHLTFGQKAVDDQTLAASYDAAETYYLQLKKLGVNVNPRKLFMWEGHLFERQPFVPGQDLFHFYLGLRPNLLNRVRALRAMRQNIWQVAQVERKLDNRDGRLPVGVNLCPQNFMFAAKGGLLSPWRSKLIMIDYWPVFLAKDYAQASFPIQLMYNIYSQTSDVLKDWMLINPGLEGAFRRAIKRSFKHPKSALSRLDFLATDFARVKESVGVWVALNRIEQINLLRRDWARGIVTPLLGPLARIDLRRYQQESVRFLAGVYVGRAVGALNNEYLLNKIHQLANIYYDERGKFKA